MKDNVLNFTQTLKDFNGAEVLGEEQKPIVYSVIVINALMHTNEEDKTLSGVDKLTRFKLAERIFTTPQNITLTDEEKKLINDVVGKLYSVFIVGTVNKFLEG